MFLKRQYLRPRYRVPHLARPIITTSNEPVSTFIEGAICEGKQVGAQDLKQGELLFLVFHLLLNKF